jgi:hypothetical protein
MAEQMDDQAPPEVGEYQRDLRRMRRSIHAALSELGVPDESYPAPVANAVRILREALG